MARSLQTSVHRTKKYRKIYWAVPVLAACSLFILSWSLSRYLLEREHDHIRSMTSAALTHVQSQVQSEIEGRIQAMERISDRWAVGGMPTKNSWDEEASLYIRHYPGIQAVSWVSPSFTTRWVVPYEHNRHLIGETAGPLDDLQTARERRRPVVIDGIDLPRAGPGFAIFAPIHVERADEFHGFTCGLFRGEKLFQLMLANVATDFFLEITDSRGTVLYSRSHAGESVHPWALQSPVEIRGLKWQINLWPSPSFLKNRLTPLPVVVLCGGVLLGFLLGGITYLLQQSRLRAYRIARINLTLKRQMKRRRTAEGALRETGERLHLALKSSGMGTWRLDLLQDVMSWDESMFGIFGLSPGVFHGGYEDFLNCVHKEDREAMRSDMAKAVETASDYHARYRILLPDGNERTLESRGRVHHDERGKAVYLSGVTWDITEQRKAEEIERYAAVLQRSNEELERFAYVASHDLKSPLGNIVHYTNELLKGTSPREHPQIILERMHQAAVRMSALIDGLLEYSRAETEAQKMESVELEPLLEEIVLDLESHIREHGGSVEIGHLPSVIGDRLQLRQLFQNLIANGIKFHPPQHPTRVKVSSPGCRDGLVEILVEDNGIGIEKEYLEAIFKPFNRLHRRDEYEGSGIGLATCQRIIQRHGGTIEVESRLGEGSVFHICLPYSPLGAAKKVAAA